ncbi:MAG: Ig-like domain repeat protein, partial [Anaerolineaceae bacterium]
HVGSATGTQLGADQTLSGGTASVTVATGTAPLANAGTYTVYAEYLGTAQVETDKTHFTTFTVTKATPTVTFTAGSTDSAQVGAGITIVVNVSGTGKKAPEGGTVSLYLGSIGGTPIATSTAIATGQNTATFNFTTGSSQFANAGAYSIWARYNGNTNVSAADSDTAHSLTLTQVTPTVSITSVSPASPQTLGTTMSFTVSVSGSGYSSPTGGTVSLYIGSTAGTPFATSSAMSGGSITITGVATGSGQLANAGTYSILAKFNGNTNVAVAESATASLVLNQVSSATSLAVSPGGTFSTTTSYTFTAKITPTTFGGQSGSVSFQEKVSGTFVEIGTGTIALVAGEYVATFSKTFAAGTHVIQAVYAGNTNFAGSTSSSLTLGP